VRAGRLTPILRRFEPPPLNIYVVYPSRRHLSAKVRAFADFLVERFATPRMGPARVRWTAEAAREGSIMNDRRYAVDTLSLARRKERADDASGE
jgi:hypothetical protein